MDPFDDNHFRFEAWAEMINHCRDRHPDTYRRTWDDAEAGRHNPGDVLDGYDMSECPCGADARHVLLGLAGTVW